MNAARFLIDTSALVPIMRQDPNAFAWQRAVVAGLVAICPIVELEFFYTARSTADRERTIDDMRMLFGWEPVDDRAYERAWEVQGELTKRGKHRNAGLVDLVLAATAELRGLILLHRDHDFDQIVAITGQDHRWLGTGDNDLY
ncbi:PIN domain-containing protein [Nocardia xishanensis]